ncbi:MAG: hypothetical protein QOF55_1298 [Thermoleophilaceae bacterium]|nr:hypothetical protein [Thermoleophilaceae bacterium]
MLELRRGGGSLPDRLRLKTIAALDAGPLGLLPVLAAVALLAGVAGVLLIVTGSASGPQPTFNRVVKWCCVALAVVAAAALAGGRIWRRRAAPRPPSEQRDLMSAAMLAAAVLLLLLLLPVHYMAARTHPTTLGWNGYGFLDKRWITTSFLILTAGAAVLLAVAARVVATAHGHPESWREWLRLIGPAERAAPAGAEERTASRPWIPTALKLLAAVLVAAYFFGPPWHLPPKPINYHETNTLGGVQAIDTGSLPYIDAAAVQYGPGAQVASYLYAKATGHFSVDGFRELNLFFNWLAGTLFLGVLYVRVRPLLAAVTTLAAITLFPTLQIFSVQADGVMHGFWGWGNTLRYAGVFVLAMLFPAAVSRVRPGLGRIRALAPALALGAVWALLCLVAQENLIGGGLVLGVLSLLLVVSDTASLRAVLSSLVGAALGFALVAVPVFAYYLAHGRLGRFLELYWLVPQAVAAGYSNTVFSDSAWARLFYGLPFLLGALLLASLFAGRPFRIATRWTQPRVVLVSALVAAVVCHLGALTRSDKPHLENTELALPAALCLAAFYLPGLLGATSRRWRAAGALAIAAVTLALLPLSPYTGQPKLVALKLWRPLHARVSPPPRLRVPAAIPRHSMAAARVGSSALPAKKCCSKHAVPMRELVRFMDRLHAVVGTRRVYVDRVSNKMVTPPAVYFLADLRPAATLEERGTMVLNRPLRLEWLRYFRSHLNQVRAIVTLDPARPAPALWVAAFPKHRTVTLRLGPNSVRVLLR